MRGSKDRVEVFKLPENLWFAGTAQLPPFEGAADGGASSTGAGAGNSGGDSTSSGNHGTNAVDYRASDSPDSESLKEELLARIRGGGLNEKTREALAGAASSASEAAAAASAPAAAPASAPAPAVDPLEQQMNRVSPPDVALCVGNGYVLHTVNIGEAAYSHLLPLLTRFLLTIFASPTLSLSRPSFPPLLPLGSDGCVRQAGEAAHSHNPFLPIFTSPNHSLSPPLPSASPAWQRWLCTTTSRGSSSLASSQPTRQVLTQRNHDPSASPPRSRTSLHTLFFGMLPWVVEKRDPFNTSVFGDDIGDMTCTYDRQARRFYLSTYWTVSRGGGALECAVLLGAAGQAKRFYLSTYWSVRCALSHLPFPRLNKLLPYPPTGRICQAISPPPVVPLPQCHYPPPFALSFSYLPFSSLSHLPLQFFTLSFPSLSFSSRILSLISSPSFSSRISTSHSPPPRFPPSCLLALNFHALVFLVVSGKSNNTYDKFGQTRRRGNITVGGGLIVAASTTDDPTQPWNSRRFSLLLTLFSFPLTSSHSYPLPPHVSSCNSSPISHWLDSVLCSALLAPQLPTLLLPTDFFLSFPQFPPSPSHGVLPFPNPLLLATTASTPMRPGGRLFTSRLHRTLNDGINSNPDWRAPLHYNTSRLTTFRTLDDVAYDGVCDGTGDGWGACDVDYPQIGTDAYVDYPQIGTDAYGIAISKSQLQTPENATILRFAVPYTETLSNPAFTIYPQKVAADGDYDYSHGGTMYFGWTGVNPNPGAPNETVLVANYSTVGAFAITGTSALGTPEAESLVEPHCAAVNTPLYFNPLPVEQKPGPVPLAWKMNQTIKPIGPAYTDARGVVVFPGKRQMWLGFMSAFGKDMSASAAVVRLRLSLRPQRKWRPFRVFLERFKAVGMGGGNSLIQPTIALNRHGKGIIAASLAGRSFYPSAAYATLNANVDIGRVVVAGAGKAPLDDYKGYREGATEHRYGDYMAATVDEEGNAWAAVQYVAGEPRSEWSNWATYVFKVDLHGGEDVGNGGDGGGWEEWKGDRVEEEGNAWAAVQYVSGKP
ncbi:unnamed protein product [Closterium sp. Naga37s-1]|nr:unnamed protein product [Closterium sp. Naga37s-1]